MTDERAVELVKWGPALCRPRLKYKAEYTEAIAHVRADYRLWASACWTEPK